MTKTLTAETVSAASISSARAFLETLSVAVSSITSFAKSVGKSLTALSTSETSVQKRVSKTLEVRTESGAFQATGLVIGRVLAVVSESAASLSRRLSLSQILSSVTRSVALMATEPTVAGGGGGTIRGILREALSPWWRFVSRMRKRI